jgi:hypothetical protein
LENYYHTIDAGELMLALMVRVKKLSSGNCRLCIVKKYCYEITIGEFCVIEELLVEKLPFAK